MVGHLSEVSLLREQLQSFPGLFLTGNYLNGVGIPDCVHEAQNTAEAMGHFLKRNLQN